MSAPETALPRVLVAEDGAEYTERFTRLLGSQFSFARVGSFAELLQALSRPAAALVLDLDFRRTPPSALVDARGAPAPPHAARELAEVQGLLLLRALRARGESLPALLCADLDDPERARLLCEELAPLQISPSSEGLPALAARLHALARAQSG
jgi:CheY-like chemotaxis protein